VSRQDDGGCVQDDLVSRQDDGGGVQDDLVGSFRMTGEAWEMGW
jgi:hypothetical protein